MRTFSVERTAQAAGILLQAEEGHRMKYIRLLKLLYVADRESIRQSGFPITGDNVYAMRNGPVLSTTYNLLKGEGATPEAEHGMPIWKQWILAACPHRSSNGLAWASGRPRTCRGRSWIYSRSRVSPETIFSHSTVKSSIRTVPRRLSAPSVSTR